jgi:toxin ParE1/3/4
MNVCYAPRAVADLASIGEYTRGAFGNTAASALEIYISATIARIAAMPESGEVVPERQGVRVVPLIRYPFRIFYTVAAEP